MGPTDVDALVTEHLAVVTYQVRALMQRLPAHVHRDDLMSAGHLALVRAARSYDDSTGVPFGRWAALRIRGALVDELRSMDWTTWRILSGNDWTAACRNRVRSSASRSASGPRALSGTLSARDQSSVPASMDRIRASATERAVLTSSTVMPVAWARSSWVGDRPSVPARSLPT